MIAGIGPDADIDIYLDAPEIILLKNTVLHGVLINTRKPKRQGLISLSVNDLRKMEKGFGIGIDDSKYWDLQDDFCLDVFLGFEWYEMLVENKSIGTRHRMMDGSKVTVYNSSRLGFVDLEIMKTLEFYRDHKDRLRDCLG
jgi:hypothetical protein